MKDVYIVSAVRTPIGSFGGVFKSLTAVQLGTAAIKGALERANVAASEVQEVYMGNVVSSNLGQAPARQAAIAAGINDTVPCTTVNKVCASGMKATMIAAQTIALGQADCIVAGGMESMSNIPYYAPAMRWGTKFGPTTLEDGLEKDGLRDAYDQQAMGIFADETAEEMNISREAQDAFAIRSYKRAAEATDAGHFSAEIVPVAVPQRRKDDLIVTTDEEYTRVKFEKVAALRPAFTKTGTVTAANASTINDGASAIILMSGEKVKELGLKPMAKIISFADAAHKPSRFTTAPPIAAEKALKMAGKTIDDIDFFEINEAFSVVTMAFEEKMNVPEGKTNVFGGAVSLGHPLGCSGARIITTLNNVLHQKDGTLGMAAICNGGGGASALIIEKV